MTTKLCVLAKVLGLVVLLAAPAAARAKKLARRAKAARARSHAAARRTLRVCAAKRAEEKATPSIEPEWPSSPVAPPKDYPMAADATPLPRG